ncbi:hypothetical protein HZA55_08565 [Candidatus Poribacteria bacterium]|nr:hypothetical protein [Candidatus Poribacteria bacterium]
MGRNYFLNKLQDYSVPIQIYMFVLGLSGLLYEILLIKIFSVFVSSLFASIFISLSLFGIGIGNALSYKFSDKTNLKKMFFIYSLSFLLVYAFFYSTNFYPVFFAEIIKHFQKIKYVQNITILQSFYIILIFIAISIPMVLNGLIYAFLFSFNNKFDENLYIYNMLGSGSGVLISFYFLRFTNPLTIILMISLIISTLILFNNNKTLYYSFILLILILFSHLKSFAKFSLINRENKGVPVWEGWNHISRVTVIKKNNIDINVKKDFAPSRETYAEYILFNNNDQGSPLFNFVGDFSKIQFLKGDITAFPYYLKSCCSEIVCNCQSSKSDVLILGPGGGMDILVPLLFHLNVTAVEINPLVVRTVNEVYGAYTGHIYSQPNVNTVLEDARTYLRYSSRKYDIISMLFVHPEDFVSSNNFSFIESYTLTQEAFHIYISNLSKDGILQICGTFNKNEILRIVASCKKTFHNEKLSGNPYFIILAASQKLKAILFKKNGFNPIEKEIIFKKANEFKLKVIYPNKETKNHYTEFIENNTLSNFDYDIAPVNDNSPFFLYFKKRNI